MSRHLRTSTFLMLEQKKTTPPLDTNIFKEQGHHVMLNTEVKLNFQLAFFFMSYILKNQELLLESFLFRVAVPHEMIQVYKFVLQAHKR